MAQFPRTEAEKVALASQMIAGFGGNTTEFPNPTVDVATLQQLRNDYILERGNATAAQANARIATAIKDEKLEALEDGTRADLRYAESVSKDNPEQLTLIGWAPPSPPTGPQPPGQPIALEVRKEYIDQVLMDWKKALSGGPLGHYRIERQLPDGLWEFARDVYQENALISNLPRGVELSFRVIAVNHHGDSVPSNTVTAVL